MNNESISNKINKKDNFKRKVKRELPVYIFVFSLLIIPLINWIIFWVIVNFKTILMAFKDQFGNWTFDNFKRVYESLTEPIDPNNNIQVALKNTLKYFSASLFINLPLSLIISYFIYKKIFMYKIFRIIFYLPCIISGVVMSTVYMEFISPNGPLGVICDKLNIFLPSEGLLANSKTATWTIVVFSIWTGLGGNILLLSGAMSRIPYEVLEAAKLDGIKPFREIISFVLPLIWPTLSSMIVLIFVGLLGSSGPILLFSPRGDYETTTVSYWIFYQVYGGGGTGTGNINNITLVSAAGICFTLISIPITLTVKWLSEKVDTVEY